MAHCRVACQYSVNRKGILHFQFIQPPNRGDSMGLNHRVQFPRVSLFIKGRYHQENELAFHSKGWFLKEMTLKRNAKKITE